MNNLERNLNSKKKDNEAKLDRKAFLKKLGILAAGTAVLGLTAKILSDKNEDEEDDKDENIEDVEIKKREILNSGEFKKLKADLEFKYKEIYPDMKIGNLEMLGDVGKYGADTVGGKILRTLRFRNVTRSVEEKYNLPKHIILAMVMEETTGADLIPNARDDGGFGLCHMQGSTAKEFGLKTFENCDELVCKEGHAKRLRKEIEENNFDRKKLINKDDRLHPILNLDAVGRMLACYMSGTKLKGRLSELDPLKTAIARYAGSYNYKNYWNDITHNMKLLKSKKEIEKVRKAFNNVNKNLIINEKQADFDIYIEESLKQNFNYGLESYKNGKYYLPKNSEEMKRKYD